MKRCPKCGETKDVSEFHKGSAKKDGLQWECKVCNNARSATRYVANSLAILIQQKEYTTKNRFIVALVRSNSRSYLRGHLPCSATAEEIEVAFEGKCEVCGVLEVECSRKLHMDHDHKTGNFRGWLCSNCNHAVGHLKDSPEIMRNLAEYIERSKMEGSRVNDLTEDS